RRPPRDVLTAGGSTAGGQSAVDFGGGALPGPHRAIEETGPLVGGFGSRPVDLVDRLAQPGAEFGPGPGRHRGRGSSWGEIIAAPTEVEIVDGFECGVAEQFGEPV